MGKVATPNQKAFLQGLKDEIILLKDTVASYEEKVGDLKKIRDEWVKWAMSNYTKLCASDDQLTPLPKRRKCEWE